MITKEERRIWQTVFDNPQGKSVLAAILNKMGFFSANPSLIEPKQIATCNWMLNQIGSLSVENLGSYIDGIVSSASNLDIDEHEKKLGGENNV